MDRGFDWSTQREKAVLRDKNLCRRCKNKGNDVHHLIPYRIIRSNSIWNLVTLCDSCHKSIENIFFKIRDLNGAMKRLMLENLCLEIR